MWLGPPLLPHRRDGQFFACQLQRPSSTLQKRLVRGVVPRCAGRLLPWRTPSAFAAPRAADTPPSSRSAPCAQGWAAGALPRRLPGLRDRLGLGRLRRVGTLCALPIGRTGRLVLREGRVPEPRTGGLHVHRAEVKAEPPASSRRGCAYRLWGAPGCGR